VQTHRPLLLPPPPPLLLPPVINSTATSQHTFVAYVDSKYLVRPNYLHQSIKGDQQFVTPQLTLPDYDHDHDCSLMQPNTHNSMNKAVNQN
jgi:hypothetical protein